MQARTNKNDAGTALNEFRIHLKFLETKQIAITIKMATGYINIKGAEMDGL